MTRLSIRWRLTLWYGGVLAVVLTAFGTLVYFSMQHQLLRRVDQSLDEELADVLSEVYRAESSSRLLAWLERRFGQHEGFDFQITTLDGARFFANARLGDRWLPIPESAAEPGNVLYQSTGLESEGRWRVVSQRAAGPEGGLIVQVARSLGPSDREMAELLAVLGTAGPLSLLVALGGGYWLAQRALSPVERMTRAAQEITAQRLDQRLEVAGQDDELQRLAQTLNGMLERLERSFREMQRFTADASHELRTPIAIIRTEAELALDRPLPKEEKQDLLGNILEECERLAWMTDQLLSLSREDAGIARQVREQVDLAALVRESVETMRPLADAKEQSLMAHSDGQAVVCGDRSRLRQVLYNLLDNAIKYTPSRGRIDVEVGRSERSVSVRVRDSGIGIAAEHLPHVFQRFYRVDKARSRAQGGAGLGLSIVESIVAAHGGEVEIESAAGRGTTCLVNLPRTRLDSPGDRGS